MDTIDRLYDEIFPIKIFHNDYYLPHKLNINEKIYLAIFNKCYNYKKTEMLMLHHVSKPQVINIKKHLIELGLIIPDSVKSVEQAKEFCIANSHRGFKCEWCGNESYILHKHHYPIPLCKGGTDIVNICPNCHSTFHSLLIED